MAWVENTHQGTGIGAVNAKEGDWWLCVLGWSGIGPGSVDDGLSGELLAGSADAGLGKSGGQHGERGYA